MGSGIQLPALHLNPPPQQPSPLEQAGQLMQLRNQMQVAPLQMQAMQQENQQRQNALNDQRAATASMQQWDGKDFDTLGQLMLKNGASATAVIGLKQHALEQRKMYSDIAQSDAATGATNLANMKNRADQVTGQLTGVLQLPDDQLIQGVTAKTQELAQSGLLDPQHVQQVQQILQSGDPKAIRQGLGIYEKSLMSNSQLMEQAAKEAEIAASKATTAKTNAELNYYQQNGGAPGVSSETMELNSFLHNNPTKTPEDFVRFKAQNSPSVVVQNLSQGSAPTAGGGMDMAAVAKRYGMTQPAFDQQAERYYQTGQLPQIGRSANAIAMNRDLMNRAAELHPGESLAANAGAFKANSASLGKLQTTFDQVDAFEKTAVKNLALAEDAAKEIPDLGAKFANVPVRMISGSMIGTPNMAKFNTLINTASAEAAKVLNSSNASGVLSDSARHELQAIVDKNATFPAIKATFDALRQDMSNRHNSYQEQIDDIKKRMGGGGTTAPSQGGGSVTRYKIVNGQLVPE